MKKHPTEIIRLKMHHAGKIYLFPKTVAEKYCINSLGQSTSPLDPFDKINSTRTKPGALLFGLRAREHLSQITMAKKIKVTQSDISQMETGRRIIGRKIAKRIAKLFCVDYRLFLA